MAALATLEANRTTASTLLAPIDSPNSTTPQTTQARQRGINGLHRGEARPRPQTVPEVEPSERGEEDERNQADPLLEADQGQLASKVTPADDGEASRVRSELGRGLVQRVDQLVALVGDISLATHLQILKRDLSRCHDALKGYPSEGDFLSIVTLVESAMAQLKWKQFTRPQLDTIRQALDIGYRQVHVRFEDYEKARTLFRTNQVNATPRIDLDSLNLEDLADGEEG